jgi:hypothetical protein
MICHPGMGEEAFPVLRRRNGFFVGIEYLNKNALNSFQVGLPGPFLPIAKVEEIDSTY